jgi:adhesin/invasin
MMNRRYPRTWVAVMCALVLSAACDRAQLLAPTSSTISVSAATRQLPLGGSTEVTAFVAEQSGTPVQNGTTVRFSTSLGTVNPVEAQTRNGLAVTTFLVRNTSGVADVRATSGAASGTSTTTGTGTTATTTTTNVVQITIGAAAASRVAVTASPATVSSSGGTSVITATVLDGSGNPISGVPVVFSTTGGTLSSSSATSDANGRAIVTLSTSRESEVTARVGSGADARSASVTVRVNVQGTVTLVCLGTGTAASTSCTQVAGSTVSFTAARGTTAGAASIASARIDFGDGASATLGNLASTTTVNHIYQNAGTFTGTLTATDANGEVTSASVAVIVTAKPPVPPLSVTFTATESTKTTTRARWTFVADTKEGANDADAQVKVYRWNFGDDTTAETSGTNTSHVYTSTGRMVVTLEVETQDGRKATAREEIIVTFSGS